jgi:hypothetical protein
MESFWLYINFCHAVAEKFSFVGVSATNEKNLSLCELCASSEAGGEKKF